MERRGLRVGVDIGGTFTDIAAIGPDGTIRVRKLSSTPDDYSRGIADALTALLRDERIDAREIDIVIHATTVATNAVLEGKGAKTGLITTAGFRDVLEFRRVRVPELYNLDYVKPPPLVPRQLRLEVSERLGPGGAVWRALDEASAEVAAERLRAAGIEALAICLLHAYANPDHEIRVAAIARRVLGPDVFITCSHEVLPEMREYERTSTTVVNAYLGPVMRRYLAALASRLAAIGVRRRLHVMTSGGGQMSANAAAVRPAALVESGPAAGVIAAARIARRLGIAEAVTLDMGGTTAKASAVEHGMPTRTAEFEIGGGISLSSKLVKGAGYAIKLPVIDVSEIGAGGGSLLWFDRGGLLKAGPQSAGADPGPVCYGRGGRQATLTDAFVALGWLNPASLVGGALSLDAAAARAAIGEQVAGTLGVGVEEAAFGALRVSVANMVRAVKSVSTYRGRDPRTHTLIAFGGNGPLVAAAIAREMAMTQVVIPPHPGVLSACGLLAADHEQELVQAYPVALAVLGAAALATAFVELAARARAALLAEGFSPGEIGIERMADLRYVGQAFELTVPAEMDAPAALADAFHREHLRTNGHMAAGEPVELVSIRVIARVPTPEPAAPTVRAAVTGTGETRLAYFGPEHGLLATRVLGRDEVGGAVMAGPVIVEEYDSTCVVPPWAAVRRDSGNNLIVEVGP